MFVAGPLAVFPAAERPLHRRIERLKSLLRHSATSTVFYFVPGLSYLAAAEIEKACGSY